MKIKCNVRFHNAYPKGFMVIQFQNISAVSSQQLEGICLGFGVFFIRIKRENLR